MPHTVSRTAPGPTHQDRVAVVHTLGAQVLILSDGSGGRPGGRQAAEQVVAHVRERAADLALRRLDPATLLTDLDHHLADHPDAGEATAVLVVVHGDQLHGASVGDSAAWLLGDPLTDLTIRQARKPLLGSGSAYTAPFGPLPFHDRLLLASDGLLKFTSPESIHTTARHTPLEHAADALIDLVRTPSGKLPDDTSVILCAP